MKRLVLAVGLAWTLLFGPALPLQAADKVALVIGNSAYQQVARLANPVNDSGDVAAALRKLGFDVVEGRDLDKRAFEDRVRQFGRKLDGAKIALFFYAGHGLQVGGKNYLLPTDSRLERPGDLNFEALDLTFVLGLMEGEKRVNLVFLDACRDNPLARSLARTLGTRSATVGPGLATVQSAIGTMIAYATQPDNVALDGEGTRNSPFTTALLKHIATPNLEIRSMMTRVRADVLAATREKQVPWDHSSLIGDVFLSGAGAAAPPAAAAGGDEFAWSLLKDGTDPAQLRRFVEQFPNSPRRNEAAARLLALEQNKIAALPPAKETPTPESAPVPPASNSVAPPAAAKVPQVRTILNTRISGAPGDGNTSLFAAFQSALAKSGYKPGVLTGYQVNARVKVGAPNAGNQVVELVWEVTDASGKKLGNVNQKNTLAQGSLDGPWGANATAAANAAASSVIKLLPPASNTAPEKQASLTPTPSEAPQQLRSNVSITIAPVIGAPDDVARSLASSLGSATQSLGFSVGSSGSYVIRGYTVAAAHGGGIKVSYIWDIVNQAGQRVDRVVGEEQIASSGSKDPWSAVTPQVIQRITSRTAASMSVWANRAAR